MTTEQLLAPRYKAIASYPGSCFVIGEIIQWNDKTTVVQKRAYIIQSSLGHGIKTEIADQYPHLFRKLEWWEDRAESEMPEYVKFNQVMGNYKFGEIVPVFNWYGYPYACIYHSNIYCECLLPATKDDYDTYKSLTDK